MSKYKYGKTLSIPFPDFAINEEFEASQAKKRQAQFMGAPMPDEGFFSALAVSMPVSYPCGSQTVDVHDRIWPTYWVPGFNPGTQQAQGLQFALPMWENSGATVQDVVGGYQGTAHKFDLEDVLQIWGIPTYGEDIYPFYVNDHHTSFGPMAFDIRQGGTITFWAAWTNVTGLPTQFIFFCNQFYVQWVWTQDGTGDPYGGTGYFILNYINDLAPESYSNTSAAFGPVEGGNAEFLRCWHHYAFTIEPSATNGWELKMFIDGEQFGATWTTSSNTANADHTGYFKTDGVTLHTDNVFYDMEVGSDRYGLARFQCDFAHGDTISGCMMTMSESFTGSGDPPSVFTLQAVKVDDAPLPTTWSDANALLSNLTTASVSVSAPDSTPYSVDVSSIVQEITDRSGWTAGNEILFVATHTSGTLTVIASMQMTNPVVGENPVIQATGDFIIGAESTNTSDVGGNTVLNGNLKDFRIYTRAVSKGEIDRIYRNPEDLYESPLPVLRSLVAMGDFVGSGGVLGGGSADVSVSFVGTGGALLAGSADVSGGTLTTTSGGVLAGGVAPVTTSWAIVPSGGLVLSEYPFLYRRTITVPAAKVSEDLDNFYLGISVVLDPAKVGEPTFNFTNPALHDLPFELREYDPESGRLTAYVRTPVTASTDTTLYLFYGAA